MSKAEAGYVGNRFGVVDAESIAKVSGDANVVDGSREGSSAANAADGADVQQLIEEAVCREPLQRELKFAILSFCRQRRELADIEAYVADLPQFAHAAQNQYHMIHVLERAGGLRRIELDAAGAQVTLERTEGLSVDEVDDLVVQTLFETTEAGIAFVGDHAPAARFARLLAAEPYRSAAFLDVLRFCNEQPRSYGELTNLLFSKVVALSPSDGLGRRIQPSVFLDRLERCGFIEWDDGWRTTKEGGAYVKQQAQQ